MKKEMCEAAKRLTATQLKEIYSFIYENSLPDDPKRKEWADGWYSACLAEDNAVVDMLKAVGENKKAPLSRPSPTYIQDIVIYCND